MVGYKTIPVILVCVSTLVGCAGSRVRTGNVPEEGLTMSQIYHASIAASSEDWTPKRRLRKSVLYSPAAWQATEPVKALDNPAIPIFIYPHVALIGDEQIIKPGYTTAFFLYKQNQFALASEQY